MTIWMNDKTYSPFHLFVWAYFVASRVAIAVVHKQTLPFRSCVTSTKHRDDRYDTHVQPAFDFFMQSDAYQNSVY